MSKYNFNEQDPRSVAAFAVAHLKRHKQFALGTVGPDESPWVVCTALCVTPRFNFLWASRTDALHSIYIQTNPKVAICVCNELEGVGDYGLYVRATARELRDPAEITQAIDIRFTRQGQPLLPPEEFMGESPERFYLAETQEVWVNDDRHIKTPVNLNAIRALL